LGPQREKPSSYKDQKVGGSTHTKTAKGLPSKLAQNTAWLKHQCSNKEITCCESWQLCDYFDERYVIFRVRSQVACGHLVLEKNVFVIAFVLYVYSVFF
jgi:hypothetical protein